VATVSWQAELRGLLDQLVESRGSVRSAADALDVNRESFRRFIQGATLPKGADRLKYMAFYKATKAPDQPEAPKAVPPLAMDAGQTFDKSHGALIFVTEAERRGFLKKVLFDAERAIQEARAALDAPLSVPTLPPASPDEVAAFQTMVDEGRASGATEPAVPAPRRTRR
jgi:hypothetical protein